MTRVLTWIVVSPIGLLSLGVLGRRLEDKIRALLVAVVILAPGVFAEALTLWAEREAATVTERMNEWLVELPALRTTTTGPTSTTVAPDSGS